jgi:hypothetical protein
MSGHWLHVGRMRRRSTPYSCRRTLLRRTLSGVWAWGAISMQGFVLPSCKEHVGAAPRGTAESSVVSVGLPAGAATTSREATATATSREEPPAQGVSTCPHVFVRLYSTSWAANDKPPVSHDTLWNAVRGDAELAGPGVHYLIESDRGIPWVGATVPSLAIGERLAAAYQAKARAARPVVLCREPLEVTRVLVVGEVGPGRLSGPGTPKR